MIAYVRSLAGLPEEEPVPEDSSDEQSIPEASIPEEVSVPAEASEPAQGSEEVISEEASAGEGSISEQSQEAVNKTLHVVFYEHYVPTEVQTSFKNAFNSYLSENDIDLTVTFDSLGTEKSVQELDNAISAFETDAAAPYVFDLILGVKANLKTYVTEHFEEYKLNDVRAQYSIADSTDRRLFTRIGTTSTLGINTMVDYLIAYHSYAVTA